MKMLDAENRSKLIAVALLVVSGAGVAWNSRQEKTEAAKKPCSVCVTERDLAPKTVFARVPFNNETFPVHSEEHRQKFLQRPAYYADALHKMNLHDH